MTVIRSTAATLIAALILLLAGVILISAHGRSTQSGLEAADESFKAGRFSDAERAYLRVLDQNANNYDATLGLGHIYLLSNRLELAEEWLTRAIELRPGEASPKAFLAEAYYRRDDFERAAPLLRAAGKEAKARKLESFKGLLPYQIEGKTSVSHIPLIYTDPLPLLSARINGGGEVNFLIDTGGGEVILDKEFAEKVGAAQFGGEQWTFGGDRRGDVIEGKVDSLSVGDFVVKSLPVNILSTRRFAAAARGKQVDGIIGTILLYHFISTIDYPKGELVLRRRTKANQQQLEVQAKDEAQPSIPFWMAGDHLIVAWGALNNSAPLLFYVDTGAAGVGFTAPRSTLDGAGVKLDPGQASQGIGGGGAVKIVPFSVRELSLGAAKERDITGLFGAFPDSIASAYGFTVAGLISHQFFRPYAVSLDFDGMRLFLKRGAG
jgi:hypothetical protein